MHPSACCSRPLSPYLFALLLLPCLLLCSGAGAADAPRVVASIKPVHALLAGLMQGVAQPRLLVDGDMPAWEVVPDPGQAAALAEADLVVWVGPELEAGFAPLLSGPDAGERVVEVLALEALKVLPSRDDPGRRDPFFWLDSRNMLILLDVLGERLARLDPGRAAVYERNRRTVAERLSRLDRAMEFGYREVSAAPVFFYHDTHQYFEQAYAMHVAGAVVRVDGGEHGDAARLLRMRNAIGRADGACLFVERGLKEPHLDMLLGNGDVERVELDTFGAGLADGVDFYVEMMQANFAAIAECVRRGSPDPEVAGHAIASPDPSRSPRTLQPRYAMQDQYGRLVTHEAFRGGLQLIYFGYTFCPDICPTSLATMARAMSLLDEAEAAQVQPIFITVDPARDTPEVLAGYVKYFHPRMLGLRGSPEATQRTAELFRARYEFVPSEDGNPERYVVDHTASLFLLGRDGEFITKFAHGLPPHEVAERLRDYLAPAARLGQNAN